MRAFQPTLVVNGEAERLSGVRVTWSYFDMLGVRPALGRSFTRDEDRPDTWHEVILSDGLWRRRFAADPAIVGRTIVMNDVAFRVVGVMPATFPSLVSGRYYTAAQIWAPLGYAAGVGDSCRDCRHLRAFGRLRSGVSPAAAAAEMSAIQDRLRARYPTQYETGRVAVVRLRDAIMADARPQLLLLLGAVVFVLVIACANVANLLLARSELRRRELALRVVLGAGRRRIAAQLLTESALLSIIGGLAGLVLASFATGAISALAPASLPRLDRAGIDMRVAAFAFSIVVLTAGLWRWLPCGRRGARTSAADWLKITRTTVGGAGRLRTLLVVADLALALTLLAGAGVMLRSVTSLARVDPGFQPGRELSMQFSLVGRRYAEDAAVRAFQEQALASLEGAAGRRLGGARRPDPVRRRLRLPGLSRTRADEAQYRRRSVYPALRDDAGVSLGDEDPAETRPLLHCRGYPRLAAGGSISESTARLIWGTDDPIGSVVRVGQRRPRAVVHDRGRRRRRPPRRPGRAANSGRLHAGITIDGLVLVALVRSSSVDAGTLGPSAVTALRGLDASVPLYGLESIEALLNRTIGGRVFVMQLLAGFSAVGLLLAAVGLYGLVSYGVSQRTREVGVRMALGATSLEVLRLIVSNGVALVAAGLFLGVVGATVTTRMLGALVFGVSPLDPVAFGTAALTLVVVAVAAHVVPALRALRIDPAVALRHD